MGADDAESGFFAHDADNRMTALAYAAPERLVVF
jgi:hypothetical protein